MFASMKDRIVFITGAGKGIGRGISKVFAANGAKTFLVARSEGVIAGLAEEIRKEGGTADYCAADIASRASLDKAVAKALDVYGGIDVLCANAGIFPSCPLEGMCENDWDAMLNTNLKGTFITVQACLEPLKKSGAGRVIVTSSITGPVTGFPGWSHYAASKAGQMGFVRTAALELAKYGITVNAVQPGNIMTEGLEGQGEDYLKTMAASIPLKRLGKPEDIGNTALFLASREAGFITGQGIIVDGGQIIPESLEAIL